MNKVVLMGRLTRDPDIRYGAGENALAVAHYTLAVDRRTSRREGEPTADFISMVAFGKSAEFAEKYLRKGMKIAVSGRIQTGSYTNREGVKVYTTEVVVDDQEFAESKDTNDGIRSEGIRSEGMRSDGFRSGRSEAPRTPAPADAPASTSADGFMNIPDGIDEELPFG